jgi:hypothetical protein
MERCPCCNARLGETILCPRCKADLNTVIGNEKAAQYWLSKAIQNLQESKTEQSIDALGLSLGLKKTELALLFRDFLIRQQCQDVLDLLAQKQLLPAKQQLYKMRNLVPHSKQLQQLHTFTDYLLAKPQENKWPSSLVQISNRFFEVVTGNK